MSGQPARQDARHTWAEYQTWDDDKRWEVIGGVAFQMSPSQTYRHQHISSALLVALASHFKGKRCQVLAAPMDVVLSEEDVVQPDLLVVCDPSLVKRTHIAGPPSLVVEIVSDSSCRMDRLLKLALYARAGVREYWIVTPWPHLIEVLELHRGKYTVNGVFGKEDRLVSATFPGLALALDGVFDFPLEPHEKPGVVREPPGAYRAVHRRRARDRKALL